MAAVAAGAATLSVLGALPAAQAAGYAPAGHAAVTAPAAKAGPTHAPITVANHESFSGYDIATGPNGTAYLGWIGDPGNGRKVYLCTLPRGATHCANGVQTIAAAPDPTYASGAAGLKVLVSKSNEVTLVWQHTTVDSAEGAEGDEIAVARSDGGGPLSGDSDVLPAPSNGRLLDAALAPNGRIWFVTSFPGPAKTIQVTAGYNAVYENVMAPWYPDKAVIAFSGGRAVIAADKYGTVTTPIAYAEQNGSGATSSFKSIAKTWNVAGFGLAATTSGVALIAAENNAGYHPVVSRLSNSGWSTPTLTGDRSNCNPTSYDVVADSSGRLAAISPECDKVLALENLADTRHAAIVRFPIHGEPAGGPPQLTTAPSGKGWAAWSVESSVDDKLLVAPVLLPAANHTASKSGSHGRVTVTGPTSCLPPVDDAGVGVAGKPASGWHVASKSLKLGGSSVGSVLPGASLSPGKSWALTGTVTFASGSARSTIAVKLGFRTCPAILS